jgi:hypothetical protein
MLEVNLSEEVYSLLNFGMGLNPGNNYENSIVDNCYR